MVTPLITTTKSLGKAFPLFNSLLREGLSADPTPSKLKCPATAPVLSSTRSEANRKPLPSMDKPNVETNDQCELKRTEETDPAIQDATLITLQDPPKSKLKRQLSIDTAERTDVQRVRKKQIRELPDTQYAWADEVDGAPPSSVVRGMQGKDVVVRLPVATSRDERLDSAIPPCRDSVSLHLSDSSVATSVQQTLGMSPSKHTGHARYHTENPPYRSASTSLHSASSCSDETRSYTYQEQTLLSPCNFNLSEICQTSPFISTTPKQHKSPEKSVFIFPEQATPKKVSPYELNREKPTTSTPIAPSGSQTRHLPSSHHQQQREPSDLYTTERRKVVRDGDTNQTPGIQYPPYVTPEGFRWPATPSNSQAAPLSPRMSSSDVKSSFQHPYEPGTRQVNRCDGYEDDYARLCMLKREFARAMKYYGYPIRDSEMCRPREVSDVMRNDLYKTQRSAEERSPNEKAIRDIQEDVYNKYERSISDPSYSPKYHRHILRRPSQYGRDRLHGYSDENTDELEKDARREHWQADYRRRLFMKSDTYGPYHTDRRRPSSDYETLLLTGKTDIPAEVLDFLHSLNFHPEELENLKDYLRRGGSESSGLSRCLSGHFDGQEDHLRVPVSDTDFQRRSPNERSEGDYMHRQYLPPNRERHLGDINVRLSCGNIKEKGNKQPDADGDVTDCKCARIENEIRAMAMDAYSKVRHFNEFDGTNSTVFESMRVLRNIKCLCSHGRTVEEIYNGSVVFVINCPDIDALLDLWDMYKSGTLLKLMQEAFVTDEFKEKFGCEEIELKVAISKEEYLTCKHELEASFQKSFLNSSQKSTSFIHTRSRSEPASVPRQANLLPQPRSNLSPFRERICSDSSVELSPRRAFQEINTREIPIQPHSPSKKFVPDNVFFTEDPPRSPLASISPLTSPRRKSFGTKLQFQQQQQENVEQKPDVTPTTSGTPV